MSVLPDLLREQLKVVFCGTAAGIRSAQVSAYYAGRGNKFWTILHQIGLTPDRQLPPEEFQCLLDYGIGLTDLVKTKAGADSILLPGDFGRSQLKEKMRTYSPKVLCFNGKRAAQEFLGTKQVKFGMVEEMIGLTKLFVVPSTSGAANGHWDPRHWQELAKLCLTR